MRRNAGNIASDRNRHENVAAEEPGALDAGSEGMAAYIPLLLVGLTLAVLWPLLAADFTSWDDKRAIVENPWLNPPTAVHFAKFWDPRPPVYMDIYIPLTYSVWSGLAWMGYVPTADPESKSHLNSWLFHGANVAVHLISVLLVYQILKLLVKRPWAAAAGAALFAIHPLQVEPVGWAAGLKDVLCGCLGLLAIWQYLLAAKGGRASLVARASSPCLDAQQTAAMRDNDEIPRHGQDAHATWHYIIATLALIAAMLAKPSGIVVPLMAGVLDVALLRRPLRKVARSIGPWLLLMIPFIIEGRIAQPALQLAYVTPIKLRPLIAADALAYYLYKLFFPVWLGITYNRSPEVVIQHGWLYYTWIVPVAVVAGLWIGRKRFPWLLAAVGVFWVAVLPVLGLVPFDFQVYSTTADHYLYLAMLGPALAVAYLLRQAHGRAAVTASLAILGLLGFRAWLQTWTWKNNVALYQNAIAVNPSGCAAYSNLGSAYEDQHRYPEAIQTFRDGLQHSPHCVQIELNLAPLLGNLGELDEAERLFRDAASHAPNRQQAELAGKGLETLNSARQTTKAGPATQKPGSVP